MAGCIVSEYDTGIIYCDINQARSSGREGGYIFLNLHHGNKILIKILRYGLEKTPAPPSSTTTGLYIEDWQIGRLPLSHFKIQCCVPDNTTFVVGIVIVLNILITFYLL